MPHASTRPWVRVNRRRDGSRRPTRRFAGLCAFHVWPSRHAPPMGRQIGIIGGGAAGFFAAITAAEAARDATVTLLEATAHLLAKVKVSGGGRCNVTHACFEPRELVKRYPRGSRELMGPFHRWQPRDTISWFTGRGVELKTESDGRMFPITDDSTTIVQCLMTAAQKAGVQIRTHCALRDVDRLATGFSL